MAYIGSTPTSQNFTSGTDYFSGTGSQTAFTLTRTVNSVNDIEVVINNVVQQPSTAYTLSGTTITFTSAPSSGTNNIYVRYLATNMQSFTVPANSITRTQLDSNLQAGFQGRNKIINGSMVVDQRNAGASVTPTTSAVFYITDRFRVDVSQNSKLTTQQNQGSVTPPAGFTNYLGVTSSSAYSVTSSDNFTIRQYIEGYNCADLGWGTADAKTVTLSFWVRSSLTGTLGGSFSNFTYSYPFTYTINSANTWEQKSITVVGPTVGTWTTTNAGSIYLFLGLGVGTASSGTAGSWQNALYLSATGATSVVGTSGATFYITGVQLEEGTTATSFEREIYSTTLQKCQRYYYQQNFSASNYFTTLSAQSGGTGRGKFVDFPVSMRAAPTGSFGTLGNAGLYNSAFSNSSTASSVTFYTTTNSSGISMNVGNTGLMTAGNAVVLDPVITGSSNTVAFTSEL